MGNTMKEKQGTNVEGVEDEKSMDIAHILGIRKSGGIFGTDEYDVHYGKNSLKVSKSEYMRMQQYVADGDPERAMALFNELNKKETPGATPSYDAMGNVTGVITPTSETPTPVVEQAKVEAKSTTPNDDAKDEEQPKSRASKDIRDLATKHKVDPDDLEFGMNHPNIDAKADIAAGKAGVDTPEGIKAFYAKNIESAGPNGEKLSKLEQSGQAQNQAPIVLKGGDTVNNVVTNNNTSSGGSGGGAGSPSRIGSPFDRFTIGNLWTPSP